MEILNKLTAAETYFLIDRNDATFKNLLKYTLVDLLLKRVLVIEEQNFQPDENDPPQTISFIKAGAHIRKYKPQAHEEMFLKALVNNEELEILFKHYVTTLYENIGSKKSYIKSIRKSKHMRTYLNKNFFTFLFGTVSLTEQGKQELAKVNEELKTLEKTLPKLIESAPEKAKAILDQIHANVLLLNMFDLELLKKIDDQFKKVFNNTSELTRDTGGLDFILFDTEFDTAFESNDFSSSDSTGCSDSGCSGCSGCGGCGGCGGCS